MKTAKLANVVYVSRMRMKTKVAKIKKHKVRQLNTFLRETPELL